MRSGAYLVNLIPKKHIWWPKKKSCVLILSAQLDVTLIIASHSASTSTHAIVMMLRMDIYASTFIGSIHFRHHHLLSLKTRLITVSFHKIYHSAIIGYPSPPMHIQYMHIHTYTSWDIILNETHAVITLQNECSTDEAVKALCMNQSGMRIEQMLQTQLIRKDVGEGEGLSPHRLNTRAPTLSHHFNKYTRNFHAYLHGTATAHAQLLWPQHMTVYFL